MIQVSSISELNNSLNSLKKNRESIALVPTRGNLHKGHLLLVKEAEKLAQNGVVSIFVNPLQFGPNEDLSSYPRTLDQDIVKLKKTNCKLVFTPSEDIFSLDSLPVVDVGSIGKVLCGISRPIHFNGVATIVKELINLFNPEVAVFGKKDYQQLFIIKKLVRDFDLKTHIIGVDTYRHRKGLAESSRNQYLTRDELKIAPNLYTTLLNAKEDIVEGTLALNSIEVKSINTLSALGFKVDYFKICCSKTLQTPQDRVKDLVICVAAYLGKTRLIDNIEVL